MNKSKNSFAENWGKFVIKHKWAVLLLTIVLAMGLGSQGKMEFDGDYHDSSVNQIQNLKPLMVCKKNILRWII